MLNKKGGFEIGSKIPFWILFGIIISILGLTMAITIAVYNTKLSEIPPQLKSELITLRFTNSADCFAYQDEETKRVYPGVIDEEKFNEEMLSTCYKTDEKKGIKFHNFKLFLPKIDKTIITNKYFNHNKDSLTIRKSVLIKKDDQYIPDELIIYVQERIGK